VGCDRGVTDPLIETTIAGRYRVERRLGAGGMGTVYAARHLPSDRTLAVKVLHPELAETELLRRFQREGIATAHLDHPNIVEVLDMGPLAGGGLYLAMELVHGDNLDDLLAEGPLGARRTLVLVRQVLDAIGHAHAAGMVHRDLKPENMMVVGEQRPGGRVEIIKLLDFGLVKLLGAAAAELGGDKLTATGVSFGTPAYMSPEQILGRPVDGRTDLYALGVILFELLTGRRPFEADDSLAMRKKHVTLVPPSLSEAAPDAPWATAAMEALVATALHKEARDRFPDAGAMTAALEQAFLSLDHLPAGT
jgi:eukaryotic-like serine/threonine-protein kinase